MPRKVAKTYLPPETASILERLCERYGQSEGEILRIALVEYAEKRGLFDTDTRKRSSRQRNQF